MSGVFVEGLQGGHGALLDHVDHDIGVKQIAQHVLVTSLRAGLGLGWRARA